MVRDKQDSSQVGSRAKDWMSSVVGCRDHFPKPPGLVSPMDCSPCTEQLCWDHLVLRNTEQILSAVTQPSRLAQLGMSVLGLLIQTSSLSCSASTCEECVSDQMDAISSLIWMYLTSVQCMSK